jgi:chromosome segregation protein
MHLRSIALKGFKSFPDRTKLEFTPGVSVIVGPNGSGKSNITDAVLWALGEQSPLAVRGQTMQDVIFAGGHGLPSRNAAEVEVVIDNSDGGLESEFSDISIVRRLDRSGEGEYRLNGARCRLVDVLEVLSDTGLGKEMHSVVSQGRVEAIIHSKPRDRRLLIEEAAGLGKHRKRRRRAQLKLERTHDNLDRALDVEREARSRLRPLKRQAEAAELHERLERQSLEARLELRRDDVRAVGAELAAAEAAATAAAAERAEADRLLAAVAERRKAAEEAFAEHSRAREALAGRLFGARSAAERISLRLERIRDLARSASEDSERGRRELELIAEADAVDASATGAPGGPADRIAELEQALAELERERSAGVEAELAGLRADQEAAEARRAELEAALQRRRSELTAAEQAAAEARGARRTAEQSAEAARREAARVGADLAAVNHFLRAAGTAPAGARSLAEDVGAEPGYELAVAAALGSLLRAGVAADLREAHSLLDAAGSEGGSALLPPAAGARSSELGARGSWARRVAEAAGEAGESAQPSAADELVATEAEVASPPVAGAERLLDHLRPARSVEAHVGRLLEDAWVVESLEGLPASFGGIAVTRAGRVLFAATGELRQAPAGGEERVLEQLGRRDRLVEASAAAARSEQEALQDVERAGQAVTEADGVRDAADSALRAAARDADEAAEAVRRLEHRAQLRRDAPAEGALAVRQAELTAELRAERRLAEQAERERVERRRRAEALRSRIERQTRLAADAERAIAALEQAAAAVSERRDALASELQADEELGERTAAELRSCAQEEAALQERLRKASEAVTGAEVRAQQVRDRAAEQTAELRRIAERLGLEPAPAEQPLEPDARAELETRVERLARRREQLGPVNPLAKQEYEEAVEHVEQLETQRRDLESALSELQGLIRDTDRRIREAFEETFEAAARNFEEVVQHLFPGGRGRLRLVHPEGPRPVIGGEPAPEVVAAPAASGEAGEGEPGAAAEEPEPEDELAAEGPGVEVEVTPAGKSMKRLSLLSGGEKSLVALAFLFAVFLARPCPFYILDEVEAALDDLNIDRFLQLVGRFSDRAQFIVVTHQKRTMDAADCLYGVSMGGDGVSKVVSRRLSAVSEADDAEQPPAAPEGSAEAAA